jgi:predicted ester cyclase
VSTEEYKAIVRRVVEEGTNGKNLYIFDELVSPSFVDHEVGPEPGGPESEKRLMEMITTAFPDWRWDIEDQKAEGDKVVTRLHGSWDPSGRVLGHRPHRRGGRGNRHKHRPDQGGQDSGELG